MTQRKLHLFNATALALLGLMMLAFTAIQPAFAKPIKRSLCIYDPLGANGPLYQSFDEYVIQARSWGINFDRKPYTEESVATADFKSGKCDAVAFTGIRAKKFVKFSGSLDMAGGLQTYDQLRKAIQVISSSKAANLMTTEKYETVGVMPLGKTYVYSHQKEWLQSPDALAGHTIAVLHYAKQAVLLSKQAGLEPVSASIATFGTMFNNGSVDMAYATAVAYEALELYKGLGETGGIADYVLGMRTYQVVIHKDRFQESFGQKSRTWVFKNMFDQAINRVRAIEKDIPDKYWVHISGEEATQYNVMFRKVRQHLWETGWYSHKMQRLLKKIRCQTNPGRAECSMSTEGGPVH